MARTSEGLSFVAADVEVSNDNVTWVELKAYATSIAVAGGDRGTGEVNVFDDERPIVKAGKKASQDVTVRYVYTEEAAGPFITIRGWDDTVGGAIYLRYWPKGKTAANFVFSTEAAVLTSFLDPAGEAASGDPVLCEFSVKCEQLHRSAWGGS